MTLPNELWYEILRAATYIPNEWDVSTAFRPGLFFEFEENHILAYRKVLPTRLAIVNVCRIWHNIGIQFLYGSMHKTENPTLFKTLLDSQPEIGILVKRFSLNYDPRDQNAIYVIRMCPQI